MASLSTGFYLAFALLGGVWNRGIGRGCCGSGYELELAGDFE
jgi:hypothetical protein